MVSFINKTLISYCWVWLYYRFLIILLHPAAGIYMLQQNPLITQNNKMLLNYYLFISINYY